MSVFLNTDLALGSRLECEVGEHEGGVDGEDGGARLLGVGEDRVGRPVEGLQPLHPAVKHLQQHLSCCDAEVVLGYKHCVVMQVVVVGPEVRRRYNC